jgi:hypothetical protein
MFELALEAAVATLIIYAAVRRRWSWMEHLVPVFFLLLIPVMIGFNRPNPDWIKLIQVAVP